MKNQKIECEKEVKYRKDYSVGAAMSNIDPCNDKKQLNILAQTLLALALEDIKKQKVNPLVVETYRSQERQNWLYEQGRTRPGNIVTQIRNSIHTLRNAVDIVPQREVGGKMTAIWNSGDRDTILLTKSLTKYGFEAGANWVGFKDSPHYQLKGVSAVLSQYSVKNNNYYITKTVQKALNKKLGCNLATDGIWGKSTTTAVNQFRKQQKYKSPDNGSLDATALNDLLTSI